MTSKTEAIFTCKNFGSRWLPNEQPAVGINTVLKKQQGDTLLSLQFNDASLRDPRRGTGVWLAAEKNLRPGVKGTVAYNVGARDTLASVTADSTALGYNTSLKLAYQRNTDAWVVQETWNADKNNKLVGTYDFSRRQDLFSYEHTRGPLRLGAQYSFKADKAVLLAERKRGVDTFVASYSVRDQDTMLSWQRKPFKAVVRGKAHDGGLKGATMALVVTHEFVL